MEKNAAKQKDRRPFGRKSTIKCKIKGWSIFKPTHPCFEEEIPMEHVVYLDAPARELENLLAGEKTMIIRGATGRKLPHGRVNAGDVLYFINNNAEGTVRAKGVVRSAFHSEKLSEDESRALVTQNQPQLRLTEKQLARWARKRYLVLVEVENVEAIPPFAIDKSAYGNMDDWLPVGNIETVRK
jgi:hypothetical protein